MADQEFYEIMKQKIEAVNPPKAGDLKRSPSPTSATSPTSRYSKEKNTAGKQSSSAFSSPPKGNTTANSPSKSVSPSSNSRQTPPPSPRQNPLVSMNSPRSSTPLPATPPPNTTRSSPPVSPPLKVHSPLTTSPPSVNPSLVANPFYPQMNGVLPPEYSQGFPPSFMNPGVLPSGMNLPQNSFQVPLDSHFPVAMPHGAFPPSPQSGEPLPPCGTVPHYNTSSVKHYTTRSPLPTVSILPPKNPTPDHIKPMDSPSTSATPTSFKNSPLLMLPLGQALGVFTFAVGMLALAFFIGRWSHPSQGNSLSTKEGENHNFVKNFENPVQGLEDFDKKYTIRVISMPRTPQATGLLNLKRAVHLKQMLLEAGYESIEINRDGENLVVDVGRFSTPEEEELLQAIQKMKRSKIKFGNIKLSPKSVLVSNP
jgi:hypothetical protein